MFGWPTFKIICDTRSLLLSINYKGQIEKQVSDYTLLGASSFKSVSRMNGFYCLFISV